RLADTRPPPPPLLPYTTLFRSCPPAQEAGAAAIRLVPRLPGGSSDRPEGTDGQPAPGLAARPPSYTVLLQVGFTERPPSRADLVDRKSTRLNSSHVSISYAVFC